MAVCEFHVPPVFPAAAAVLVDIPILQTRGLSNSNGLRLPASASCLEQHSRLAGRCPNNSSLCRPQAAVVVVAPKGRAYCGLRSGPSFVQPLRLALLASSPSRGAFGKEVSSQRNGELAGLSATPEPPLLGEVALRSNDGEVGQSRALSGICVSSPFGGAGKAVRL